MCDLSYLIETWETANYGYGEDTAPYTADGTVADVINFPEKYAKILFKCFRDNFIRANSDKSHLLFNTDVALVANINDDILVVK